MPCGRPTRISMPTSCSSTPDRAPPRPVPLFDRPAPSLRPDLPRPTAGRAAAVKAGRRPPPKAARSGLDRREHPAPLEPDGRPLISLDHEQSIFDFAQDEVKRRWHIEFNLILSEVEGRTTPA